MAASGQAGHACLVRGGAADRRALAACCCNGGASHCRLPAVCLSRSFLGRAGSFHAARRPAGASKQMWALCAPHLLTWRPSASPLTRPCLTLPLPADSLTTPIVQTATYTFRDTAELIAYQVRLHASSSTGPGHALRLARRPRLPRASPVADRQGWSPHHLSLSSCPRVLQEGRYGSYEYGRYGNPTTRACEEKIRELEGAEDCLVSSSGMNAATTMLLALVPAGGHIVTTTDCYRRTRQFIQTVCVEEGALLCCRLTVGGCWRKRVLPVLPLVRAVRTRVCSFLPPRPPTLQPAQNGHLRHRD